MVTMTNLSYSVRGTWNDADMLQMCTYGEGATRHPKVSHCVVDIQVVPAFRRPKSCHVLTVIVVAVVQGYGMTLTEYKSHFSVWAVLASPLIHSADLRTVKERHPDCLDVMLNAEVGLVSHLVPNQVQ